MTLTYDLDEDTIQEADAAEAASIFAKYEIHKINTTCVAKLVSFDGEGIAEVEMCVRQYETTDEGRVWIPARTIFALPVAFQGGGGQAVKFSLEPGDDVLVQFSRESIEEWRETGGRDIKPRSPELFSFDGAMVVGRVQPFSKPLAWEAGAIVIGDDPYKGGPVAVDDPLMRVRVKRGEHAELCREQAGQDKRYVRVTEAGKIAIGDDANELLGAIYEAANGIATETPAGDIGTAVTLLVTIQTKMAALAAIVAAIKA